MLLLAEKFIFLQTKPKRVTQMKVLGEYIIVAMFTEELVRTRDNNPRFMNINIIIIIYDHFLYKISKLYHTWPTLKSQSIISPWL